MIEHLTAMTLALMLDRIIGDPPKWPHPVRWIGSLIHFLEGRLNKGKHQKAKGIFHLIIVLAVVAAAAWSLITLAAGIHWGLGFVIEVLLMTSALASKSLKVAANDVLSPLEKGDVAQARIRLSWIVGRDTERLDEDEIVRGTIETVAENTSDGITAPLFWALIGGAPAIWFYKAINTGDSIVGYRNERFEKYGWATAKLDDAVNWIPSRITAALMLMTIKPVPAIPRAKLFQLLPAEAKKHPSPNSGWGEAAVALLLNIRLGGRNTYQGIESLRPVIGNGSVKLERRHIHQTLVIMDQTTCLFILLSWIGGIIYAFAATWS